MAVYVSKLEPAVFAGFKAAEGPGTDPHAILLSHFLVPPHLLSKDLPLFLDLLLLPHSSFWVGIIVEVEGCAGCTVELKRIRSCFKYRIGGKSIFKFWNKFE